MIDRHLATVAATSPAAGFCPAGATDAVEMTVLVPSEHMDPPGGGHNVDMVACCARSDATRFRQEINAVIDSVCFG